MNAQLNSISFFAQHFYCFCCHFNHRGFGDKLAKKFAAKLESSKTFSQLIDRIIDGTITVALQTPSTSSASFLQLTVNFPSLPSIFTDSFFLSLSFSLSLCCFLSKFHSCFILPKHFSPTTLFAHFKRCEDIIIDIF
jgi:hypothetical protein